MSTTSVKLKLFLYHINYTIYGIVLIAWRRTLILCDVIHLARVSCNNNLLHSSLDTTINIKKRLFLSNIYCYVSADNPALIFCHCNRSLAFHSKFQLHKALIIQSAAVVSKEAAKRFLKEFTLVRMCRNYILLLFLNNSDCISTLVKKTVDK